MPMLAVQKCALCTNIVRIVYEKDPGRPVDRKAPVAWTCPHCKRPQSTPGHRFSMVSAAQVPLDAVPGTPPAAPP